MGLSRGIFHPRFVAHHTPTVKSGMRSRVRIERVISEGTYNPATETLTGAVILPLYVGKARLEKVARPTRRDFVMDAADNQTMDVQIPLELSENDLAPAELPNYQVNDVVVVLENPDNPSLVDSRYFVHGDAGASEAWAQSLVCHYNVKQGT